jgi:ankyrin repeat protein
MLLKFDRELLELRNGDERLPFHCACRVGNLEKAKFLLEMRPESINMTDNEECSFHEYDDSERVIEPLLIEFAGFLLGIAPGLISSTTRLGNSPFHLACANGYLEMAKYLLGVNADVINVTDNEGHNCLHKIFCFHGYFDDRYERIMVMANGSLSLHGFYWNIIPRG